MEEAAEAMHAFIRRTLAGSKPLRASVIAKRYREEHGITGTDSRTAKYYRYQGSQRFALHGD
jgi:hypothetical protein